MENKEVVGIDRLGGLIDKLESMTKEKLTQGNDLDMDKRQSFLNVATKQILAFLSQVDEQGNLIPLQAFFTKGDSISIQLSVSQDSINLDLLERKLYGGENREAELKAWYKESKL